MSQRVIIITGAASGLGRECARRLAAPNVALALVDLHRDGIDQLAAELASSGAATSIHPIDISSREACRQAVDETVDTWGGVDGLVNAAGVYPRKPVLDITAADWQLVFEVNVLGTYFMMIEAIAEMSTGGRIVNVSSIDGFKAHPDNAHYAATKAAVISLTRSLALAVAPMGIVINSVAPGPMATEAAKRTDWYQPMVEALPTQHPIEPGEVARVVEFLLSPENVSIVGENLVISGGGVIV